MMRLHWVFQPVSMMTKPVATVLCAMIMLATLAQPAAAADKFGQRVASELEAKVREARRLRLPYGGQQPDPKKAATILQEVITVQPGYFRAQFNLGLALFQAEDYENSKQAFDTAIRLNEEQALGDKSVYNTAGWAAMKSGDFSRAEPLLRKAEEMTRGNGTFTEQAAASNLGELLFLTQRFDEAKVFLGIASERFGNKSAAYYLDQIAKIEAAAKK